MAPVPHWLITNFRRHLPALPSQGKPCTEDQPDDPTTYCRHLSPGAISMLAKDLSACPKQNAKGAFYKTLRNSQDSSPLVFSCLRILHNEGCSESSLRRWVFLKGVTSKSPHRTWPWLAFPKVEECAVTAPSGIWQSWWQAAFHVGDERLRCQKGPSEHQHRNTKAAVQSPSTSLLGRQPGWLWH